MTTRLHQFLLGLCLLVLLTACGSRPTQPIREPGPEQQPGETISTDESKPAETDPDDLDTIFDRSLPEIEALSQRINSYEPRMVLEVVRSLEAFGSSDLENMIESQGYDPEFTEWLELSLSLRRAAVDANAVPEAARHWRDFHFAHVVTSGRFLELVSLYQSEFVYPSRVAVLLPDQGGLASAAEAIRDGILRAYLDDPGNSALRFYSSGTSSDSAVAAYRQAIDDGADQVIGPLRLESTQAIAGLKSDRVPALLLNRVAQDQEVLQATGPITSISLSQANEAIEIATRALRSGQQRAIVIVPDSAWGRRIENAFVTPFINNGGVIAARAEYQRSTSDHSEMLTSLLKIDESLERKTRLQAQIGAPLTFEPIRRDDFDFIFLAASPQEGRELKPLLKFHDAGDVPVYSIGRIYSGMGEVSRDQDLDGIIFTAVRWQLDNPVSETLLPDSVRDGAQGKLYALGQDAWRLLPWIPLMRKDNDLSYHGEVGRLSIGSDGQVQRESTWAQFIDGRPEPFRWPEQY